MHCKNCENEISQGESFCIKCGATAPQATATNRLFTGPHFLFLSLFLAHFVSYLIKGGLPLSFVIARSVGVNFIPLAFGIFYTISGSKKSRIAYIVATVFCMVIFVGATIQSAKEGL